MIGFIKRHLMIAVALGLSFVILTIFALPFVIQFAKQQLDMIPIPIKVRPTPTGPYTVARATATLSMASSKCEHSRGIPIDFWYPVAPDANRANRPIVQGSKDSPSTHSSNGTASQSNLMATSHPRRLIFYAPGWNGARNDNKFSFASLASHGYVIAALDDFGYEAKARAASGLMTPAAALDDIDLSSEKTVPQTLATSEARLKLMVERISCVLQALRSGLKTKEDELDFSDFDLDRVGMYGFSFGGSVAAEITKTNKSFVAVANMDGWMFGESAKQGVDTPYLVFNSEFPNIEKAAKATLFLKRIYARLTLLDRDLQKRQALQETSHLLFFKSVEHGDFSDYLFSPSLKSYLKFWFRSSADRLRLRKIMDSYLLAFFNHYLRDNAPNKDLLGKSSPFSEVSILKPPSERPVRAMKGQTKPNANTPRQKQQ